jgi:hypothetical protein
LPAVHARLDQLYRDEALDRLGLLGHPDGAHAALADLLDQLVRPDDRAGALGDRALEGLPGRGRAHGRPIEVVAEPLVVAQQGLDLGTQCRVLAAAPVEVGQAVPLRGDLQGIEEDALGRIVRGPVVSCHASTSSRTPSLL